MPTLTTRFISSRGSQTSYEDDDLLFFESVRDGASALSEKIRLETNLPTLLTTHEFVIYRMSRFDETFGEPPELGPVFHVWRQRSSSMGSDIPPNEPRDRVPIGFSIYAVPRRLTSDSNLSQRVADLCAKFGQHGDPTHGGP